MADKQPHLNGAYYGPSVPPAANYHRPSRTGCGCGCCLLKLLLKIIISLVVIIGLAVLIFWLIFRPNEVKFHVTDVRLTEFSLDSNSTMRYNLAVNITVRNPNRRIGIHYDRIEARAYYEDQRLQSVALTPFYQGHKNTSLLNPVFRGEQFVRLGAGEVADFNEERISGIYSIDVKLHLRIRFKVGRVRTSRFRPRIECDLKVPLNGTAAAAPFATKRCDWDY
ncbi:NDR1/HIN1-LIKE, ARABIDOPSIS NDR1/HIN1-LIKE 10, YELLOW-LEAF-SPECIFIC GENE 9 [Hibiscus trionum]|uniref:NDR1/HIN1-LIKE, ARABIDOPSIS NDR1/HIN1-LIKE 10, YELLOW-LEAF-SPECIFIC GENE 9 n=1 Tax=Hibiscus trionum TaxID=183268 RepID=A0A9W7II93_HIBTR|nr:NDR1/HIN1-LIKE, ARABIDOPSIS NDR1/HIN1-LIKE 10, YELLOW-LEAF-SPECIFIC GENE 9 [Hibiscus trionum]